jgi:hypothetical protein
VIANFLGKVDSELKPDYPFRSVIELMPSVILVLILFSFAVLISYILRKRRVHTFDPFSKLHEICVKWFVHRSWIHYSAKKKQVGLITRFENYSNFIS